MQRALIALAAAAAVIAGCGSEDEGSGMGAMASQKPESEVRSVPDTQGRLAARSPGTRIKLRQSDFGRVLFSGGDQAIYLFTRDSRRRTRCYGACAKAWPPVFTKGRPRAGQGVKQSLLGTTERRDGRRQVTYNGRPLYFYAHEGPRQVLCQNVEEFGGLWLVVKPDGRPVR